jgi:membrane protein CcdC involved in cytochrome C biogenesis
MQSLLTAQPFLIVTALLGAVVMVAWRMREARSPVSLRKIVIPPLGMSTGFSMFFYPPTRVPLTWAAGALLLGAIFFAEPLIRTSRLTLQNREILVQRSPAFLWILLALVTVRFALRTYLETFVGPLQTGALFYLLAFGAVVRWRVSMLREYTQLTAGLQAPAS